MQHSPPASLTQSPLCTTDRMRQLLEIAELYDKKFGPQQYPSWNGQLNSLRKGTITGGPYIGYVHAIHLSLFMFESLNTALTVDTPGGSVSLKDRVEEMRIHQERNWKQLLSGEAAEFNSVIGSIVEDKLKELGAAKELTEREEVPETQEKIQSVLKILKDLNHSEKSDRESQIFKGLERIQKILEKSRARTETEEALERVVFLINSLNPQNKEKEKEI